MADWNMIDAPMPCSTAYEQELSQATYAFVCLPGPESLAMLESCLLAPNTDTTPMRKAALAMQAANAALAADLEQVTAVLAQQGQQLACGPGCTGCCHQLVLCYPFETELMGAYMRTKPEVLAFFSRSWREWHQSTQPFLEGYLRWAENFYKNNVDDKTFTVQDYFIPCPFLDNGLCRVYPVRPYACRSCVSLDASCAIPQDPKEKPGSHTLDFGSFTMHKKSRTVLIGLLWRVLGVKQETVNRAPWPNNCVCG